MYNGIYNGIVLNGVMYKAVNTSLLKTKSCIICALKRKCDKMPIPYPCCCFQKPNKVCFFVKI